MVMLAVWSLISQMVFHECKRALEQPFCFYFVWTFYSTRNAFLTFSSCFGECSFSSIIDNQCDNKPQWHHHQRRSGTGNKWVVERQKINTNLKELTFRQTQTRCDPGAKILQSCFMGNFTASWPVSWPIEKQNFWKDQVGDTIKQSFWTWVWSNVYCLVSGVASITNGGTTSLPPTTKSSSTTSAKSISMSWCFSSV